MPTPSPVTPEPWAPPRDEPPGPANPPTTLAGLLGPSAQAYFEADAAGRILAANAAFGALAACDPAGLVGKTASDLCDPADAEALRATVARFESPGAGPLRLNAELRREAGTPLPVSLLLEAAGDGWRAFVAPRPEADRPGPFQAAPGPVAEALRDARRRARALFEGIQEAVFVHALDGRILDANPAATRLLGYSWEELTAMTTAEVDDPEFAAGYRDRLERQLVSGRVTFEGRHRTKDGRVIPVEITTSSIQLDGEPAVLAVVRDISERLALEDARRDLSAKNAELTLSEARYRQLTDGSLDGVVVADGAGRIVLLNPAAERMFGLPTAEAEGTPIGRLLPEVLAAWPRPAAEPVEGEPDADRDPGLVGRTVEMAGVRADGSRFPVELSLSAVVLGGEAQYLGSVRDQTERQRMRALLVQSDRLASIGLLSAGVAHEINNPLAYVGNNLAVLERDVVSMLERLALLEGALPLIEAADPGLSRSLSDHAADFDWPYVRENLLPMINRTREGVQRIATIVGNLRGLARTTPPRMESVRVADLFEGALEMVRGRLRRSQIEVETEHGVAGPLVCVPAQISQVLLNLLVNAAQALEAAPPAGGGRIRFRSGWEGGMVVLSVSDNGAGIPPDDLPRLFDPFFTTKSVGEGTGLGLSICHGIVTGHGGRIEVASRPGEGATFRVLLPRRAS